MMVIERQAWLALLCLPLLGWVGGARADGLCTAEDWLSVWRTYSEAARQAPQSETPNADAPYPWLHSQPSGSSGPPVLLLAPAGADLDSAVSPENSRDETPAPVPWASPDPKPRKVSQKSEGLLGSLNTQVEVNDAPTPRVWDDPSWKRTWKTDEAWQMGIAGPLSVFGQLGANSDETGPSSMKVSGRTGLACKVPVGSLAEFTFRSGPGMSYTDPLHPVRNQGRSDWLLEVQARWPLLFGVGLEYQGTAAPSLTPLQQDTLNQDVRLAVSLGNAGKLKVGAKHQWTGVLDQRSPWTDTMQVYLGLELNH